jgi:Type IV secretion-system coupling protein DNA-binding domain
MTTFLSFATRLFDVAIPLLRTAVARVTTACDAVRRGRAGARHFAFGALVASGLAVVPVAPATVAALVGSAVHGSGRRLRAVRSAWDTLRPAWATLWARAGGTAGPFVRSLGPWVLSVLVAGGLGVAAAWDAAHLEQPTWLVIAAGVLVALAVWPRPRRGVPPPARPSAPADAEPGIDLGSVVRVPSQLNRVVPWAPFVLALPDLEQHVSVIGATGSGKTTTLMRFMDAALAAGWAVVVIDVKGGSLVDDVRSLARRHGVETRVWLPGDPDSSTYDACAGEPAMVSNRLLGAFEHGPNAEVYKHLGQALVPLVLSALRQAGRPADLDALRTHLGRPRLVGLARKVADEQLRAQLLEMLDDPLVRKALAGLEGRLGALRNGAFGPWLLPTANTLDLSEALTRPGITYLGLPATGASEDVALVGRLLIQDLKQVAYQHLRSHAPLPALVVVDEFATLREAVQLVDLMLQSREARLVLVVSTQFLPRLPALRHALLGSGVLIVHRIGSSEEAELLAKTLGTHRGIEITRQLRTHPDRPPTVEPFLRQSLQYLAPPDELRSLAIGEAVVSIRHRHPRLAVVQITPLSL